jgi:hypothetical protein
MLTLELAAHTADDVHALAKLVAEGGGLSVRTELRLARGLLHRMLNTLAVPDAETGRPMTELSKRKSRAAHKRWDRTAEQRAERRSA